MDTLNPIFTPESLGIIPASLKTLAVDEEGANTPFSEPKEGAKPDTAINRIRNHIAEIQLAKMEAMRRNPKNPEDPFPNSHVISVGGAEILLTLGNGLSDGKRAVGVSAALPPQTDIETLFDDREVRMRAAVIGIRTQAEKLFGTKELRFFSAKPERSLPKALLTNLEIGRVVEPAPPGSPVALAQVGKVAPVVGS